MTGKTTVVFITANVGSIFEEPSVMLKIWTQEFLSTIARLDPKFVALHCQEVGGKNYEKSMQYVEDFVQLLVNSDELRLFDKARIYLDEDYSSAENFTALGNFYFIHESVTDALIYDFEQRRFVEVEGKAIYSKDIENVHTKEKSKFPLEYFPECKWSRKGFLRTRWCLNGTIFDLVNIHLFHDVSNFVAIKSFPSVYSDTRRRALAYTLERFQTDEYGPVPLFLFGDFNFRTDTQGVVKHLSKGLKSSTSEDDVSIIQFKQEDKVVLSLGKKEFSHSDHQTIFTSKDGDWLREFDKELEAFSDQLFEFEISFPPSYPFEENSSGDRCYMKTRCPAWCDRVIMSHSAIPLVKDASGPEKVVYGLMGRNTCMGDHKPVYLKFDIKSNAVKSKWSNPSSKTESAKGVNGLLSKSNSEGNRDSEKTLKSGLNYSDVEIEKLACSLEALMSQNSSFSREMESGIEPDLSRCTSCRIHQNLGRVSNNPGGEEVSNESIVLEDKKIIALLASEIKVPEEMLQKIEIQDTGQKTRGEKETGNWDLKGIKSDRFGAVKRVNSASMVENSAKKEDWKNSRCNSDVSWSATTSAQTQMGKSWKSSKQFARGNSRIRLISSSNSLNASLPRLTSHHSSSDEEWFEEIEEGDDDVLPMSDSKTEDAQVFPDDCGDKGTYPSCAKPITESASGTNICLGKSLIQEVKSNIEDSQPSGTTSCVLTQSKPSSSGFGERKSFDSIVKQESGSGRKLTGKSSKSKPLSILKRLTEGVRKESCPTENGEEITEEVTRTRESFEALTLEPTVEEKSPEEGSETRKEQKDGGEGWREQQEEEEEEVVAKDLAEEEEEEEEVGVEGDKKRKRETLVETESWETIELGGVQEGKKSGQEEKDVAGKYLMKKKLGKGGKCGKGDGTNCCCVLQ